MSECVVRMRMPSKDTVCGMVFDLCGVWYCPVMKKLCRQPDNGEIPSWCPIICSIPEGHGRLIDWDAFERIGFKLCRKTSDWRAELGTPTNESYVVPAEGREA